MENLEVSETQVLLYNHQLQMFPLVFVFQNKYLRDEHKLF